MKVREFPAVSLSCHYRAAASREQAQARERTTLRDPVIHEGHSRTPIFIMDYRDSSAPRLAFRSPVATPGNDET